MRSLGRFRTFVVAAGVFTGTAACSKSSDTKHAADHAASRVNDTLDDLKDESHDLADKAKDQRASSPDIDDIADQAKKVGNEASELREAITEFKHRRTVRIQTLRAVHAVAATQPMLINAVIQSFPLVEKDRAGVTRKLRIFQVRLDEAGHAIESLELVEPGDWERRSDAATKVLERVDAAREDVWDALNRADRRTDRTSMR